MGSKGQSSPRTSSGDDGGGGTGGGDAAPPSPPPTAPSGDPRTAPPTSPSPLQPPRASPRPADRETDEGPDGDYMPEEEDDGGWNWEQEEAEYNWGAEEGEIIDDADSRKLAQGEVGDDQDLGENLRGPSDSEFFCILFMSHRKNIPDHIIRNGFVPLSKLKYFSWHQIWSLLLDRYRSYLRPPKDHRVLNRAFRCPYDCPRALAFQEPILDLIQEYPRNYVIQEKIKILSKQYGLVRRTCSDSRFYRALLFAYLENLGQMQDRQAEVIRLMGCVEVSMKRFYQLEWEKAYFLNPKEYLSSVVYEFYRLVNSVANGLTSDKLHEKSLEAISSGRIISLLRLLTEVEIRTQDIYKPFIPKDMNVLQFCRKQVRGLYAEAAAVQMRALTFALGIPLRVEIVDKEWKLGQAVRVKRLDFNPAGLGKAPFHLIQSYFSSSTAHKPVERGSDDKLLSSDGAPLPTLLIRHGHCDILYPK